MSRALCAVLGLVALLALVVLDHWLFEWWFGIAHWRWYLSRGAAIGLATTVASLAWGDLNKNAGLIAAHPLDYLGACLQLVGLPVYSFGTHSRANPGALRAPGDGFLTLVLGLVLVVGLLVWVIVIAPLQYFVFFFCGGPSRYFAGSTRRPIARLNGKVLDVDDIAMGEAVPAGWWDAGLSDKPVAVTSLFSSLMLLGAAGLLL